ncbi:MAG TPA: hypothetical protein VJY62_03025 [Bacteroidia bacterium]|nr:hypothetical protein [Bacteroidia bacterium]
MKTQIRILIVVILFASEACKKETAEIVPPPAPGGNQDNYSSMKDFYAKNSVPVQTYTIDAAAGGSFTSPKGTHVTIPANAFTTMAGGIVSGNVTVQFKDIYKKSDMLLSDIATVTSTSPLVSGGEFFLEVKSETQPLIVAPGKNLTVEMPAANPNTAMQAFIGVADTVIGGTENKPVTWIPSPQISLLATATGYLWSGNWLGWGNSDNSFTFQGLPQIKLTCHPTDDPTIYQTDVFMVFKSINTCIHVYRNYNGQINDFSYLYSPTGLQCTIVAVGIKNGKLYSSFIPITISSSAQTVNFTLSKTTTDDFKAKLNALN